MAKLLERIRSSDSLEKLRQVNKNIPERKFHEHTHILHDIRSELGPEKKVYTEIGTYIGSSAAFLLNHEFDTLVHCIDPLNLNPAHYGGGQSQEATLRKNLQANNPYGRKYVIHKNFSTDAAFQQRLRKNGFKTDILFIDGNHTHNVVVSDFRNFHGLVNPGGYIVFDDYNDSRSSPQVKGAVQQIVAEIKQRRLPYQIIGCPKNIQGAKRPGQKIPEKDSNEFILRKF